MKKISIVLLLLVSFFTVRAENIETIIKNLDKAQRLDTLISFDQSKESEYLPLSIIKGKYEGPVFTLVAGIHGYEYPPIIALQELMNSIDPQELHGTLLILPIANVASFYKRSPFVNPIDDKNLNTSFPGSQTGSITDKIAYWITTQIIPISDVFLDIHGGDASEDLIPFICYYDNKDDNTDKARLLSQASDMEYIVSYPYNISKTEPAKYAFKQAVQDGIVALSIEAGKLGAVQTENVNIIVEAIKNMLDYMDIYSSEKEIVIEALQKKSLNNQSYVKVPTKGLFYSSISSGDIISKDENIGYITDVFGNVLEEILSPVDGVVLYKVGTPPVNVGETLFCIGY